MDVAPDTGLEGTGRSESRESGEEEEEISYGSEKGAGGGVRKRKGVAAGRWDQGDEEAGRPVETDHVQRITSIKR